MPDYAGAPLEEQIKKLLEQNLNYSKELYFLAKKTQKYIFWGRVMNVISLLLVLLPVIAGIIYLPSLLGGGTITKMLSAYGIGSNPELQSLLKNTNQTELLQTVEKQGGIIEAYKSILEANQ
jgi:hypothetical protein